MVTAKPSELRAAQRAPHFDSTDQKYYALLHYLRVPPGTGTAFYRQRSTGIERVTEANVAHLRWNRAGRRRQPAEGTPAISRIPTNSSNRSARSKRFPTG